MTGRLLAVALVLAVFAGAAGAARLPGVKTPSKNVRCFYVPQRPTTHGNLLCNIQHAVYTKALQARCIAQPTGLDWLAVPRIHVHLAVHGADVHEPLRPRARPLPRVLARLVVEASTGRSRRAARR